MKKLSCILIITLIVSCDNSLPVPQKKFCWDCVQYITVSRDDPGTKIKTEHCKFTNKQIDKIKEQLIAAWKPANPNETMSIKCYRR
ncbi:hypothetical protein [Dyadobacter helix]|uniref:hypothetical protein n=1 Tax=Dyadobacter helix TaxID=2822344 RepID=UPI001BFC19CB|nr:hypothetical protein [Dyadobacter sp. CECT 9275]